MPPRIPQTLDMTPEGGFRDARPVLPWSARLGLVALGVSFVTGVIVCLAVLAYLAVLLVPLTLGALALGYIALRVRLWRRRGAIVIRGSSAHRT